MKAAGRLACFLLAFVLLLSLGGCGKGGGLSSTDASRAPQESFRPPQPSGDPEIDAAIALGFVPEALQSDYDSPVTYAQDCLMLEKLLELTLPDTVPAWRERSATFRDAAETMTRGEGAAVLFYAAMASGFDRAEPILQRAYWFEAMTPIEQNFWKGLELNNPLIPSLRELYVNPSLIGTDDEGRTGSSLLTNAGLFAEGISYQNGKPYLEYDPETASMRFKDPFTRAEAIQAAYRLYGGLRYTVFVPGDSVVSGVTEETIRLAREMPAAAWNDLPDWRGYTIASPFDGYAVGECGKYFYEEEVARIAEAGFDFIRAGTAFQTVFGQSGGTEQVREAVVANIDDLVNWCAKYGIHLCFDCHEFPGFDPVGGDGNITLWDDPEQQELFCRFWGWFAEHFKDVPSNLLSFNLINEPRGAQPLTDEVYSSLMKRAIAAIREHSPDRLIFADALEVTRGVPVEGLADARVAQSIHPYFLPDGASQWPALFINGFIHRDNGVLTLNGDFPAGTTVTVDVDSAHAVSTMRWLADGREIDSMGLGGEEWGQDGCVSIEDPGTGGEFRVYEGRTWTVELAQAAHCLRLIQEEGCWYAVRGITVETSDGHVCLSAQHDFVPNETVPELTFQSDGTVSAADPDTLFRMDRDTLAERFTEYTAFRERTGVAIMVQEFGFNASIPRETARSAADALLGVLEEAHIPWCSFCSQFGLWVSKQEVLVHTVTGDATPLRPDGNYQDLGDWYYDTDMAEIYQTYMNP